MKKLDLVLDPLLDYHLDAMLRPIGDDFGLTTRVERLKSIDTIKVDPGRRTGKSCYIARSAGDQDIIFCSDSIALEVMLLRRRVISHRWDDTLGCFLINDHGHIVHEVRDVWIDDASSLPIDLLETLYKNFANKCRRFILIG